MAIKLIKLPLFNDTFYSYSIALEGNTYNLDFLFLERTRQWVVSIKDSEQNPLILGQRLTPDTTLFISYQLPELSGYFFFTSKSDEDTDAGLNIDRPREFYDLYYVFDDGE